MRTAARSAPKARLPLARRTENTAAHATGLALFIGGLGMAASALVEWIGGGPEGRTLLISALVTGLPGAALWRVTTTPARLVSSSIYAAVLSGWVAISLAATIPYLLSDTFGRFDLALFESVSGFTTTASTVLRPIEGVSEGILFWRATTQWMGGIGFVVLAVSVLPVLGVGGMDLLAAEAPGSASERLAARVGETARRLVVLYLGFTAAVATVYALFGMDTYDAVVHAFTTVSTGGYSTHDASFAHFNSAALEWIAIVAMLVAGGSFALYWRALRGKPLVVFRSTEFRAYIGIVTLMCAATVGWNVAAHGMSADLVRRVIFSTVSITSTTGYTHLDYDQWAGVLQLVLVFAMGLGGMSASTTGGFKVFRLLAVFSYSRRQLFRQLHPHAVAVVRFGREIVREAVVTRIVGFFGLFMALGAAATFLVAAFGADMRTSISAVASSIGNVGPGLGAVGPTRDFLDLGSGGRGVLMVVMLIGRLEVFPVLLGAIPLLRLVADRLPARVSQVFLRVFRG